MPQSKKSLKVKSEAKNGNGQNVKPEGRTLVRAIRITSDVLDAAKAYKKATGTSFYRLGLNAISEVLRRKGYLEPATKA